MLKQMKWFLDNSKFLDRKTFFGVNIGDNHHKLRYHCPKHHVNLVTQSVLIKPVGNKALGLVAYNTIDETYP